MKSALAIIGMSCRYPDARGPTELWENTLAGRRAFRRLPQERLRTEDYCDEDRNATDQTYSIEAAVLEGYRFDRVRFRVAGSTFRATDMTHWLALDVAAEALAEAGFAEARGLPREAVGVLVGNSLTGEFSRANLMRLRWPYVRRVVDAEFEARGWIEQDRAELLDSLEEQYKAPFPEVGDETLAGGLSNTIAGRICNHFDFGGGGYTVDGACASSLLAVGTACSALTAGDLDVAVAGGVDLSLDPFELVGFAKVGALATDQMRVYDAHSAGFWPGEGCGFVVLMRLEDAMRQNLHIHAVIRGWGISSDGNGGLTRPEVDGQLLALRRAYRRAGFGIDTVSYFEGHGTGTGIGDPTELRTLSRARRAAEATRPAAIGSIKANIGHTKAAAGIAGLIKATMALENQLLPPSTGFETPHPVIAEEGSLLRLLRQGEAWPQGEPLRAGVSAMGFGGINAHIVLESAATNRRSSLTPRVRTLLASAQDAELFLFAADDPETLAARLQRVLGYAEALSRAELVDLAARLSETLQPGQVRAAVVASSAAELDERLRTLMSWIDEGATSRRDAHGRVMLGSGTHRPAIGFLFPGQGSPAKLDGGVWTRRFESAGDLYARAKLPDGGDSVATEVAQPLIATASMAGLRVLDQLRIRAVAGIGHSLGELAAYHWAGAMDEETLLRVAAARGRAVADFGRLGGAMAGIAATAEAVGQLIEHEPVVLAGLNSLRQTVVSGEAAGVEAVVARARAMGLTVVNLRVSHAFHSPMVADSAPALAQAIEGESLRPLQSTVASTVTGSVLAEDEDLRDLLFRQMTSPVRFMEAVAAVAERIDLWIEVGPGGVLRGLIGKLVDTPVVSLDVGGLSLAGLLSAAGTAFAMGAPLNHRELFESRFTRRFDLDWQPRFLANPCELGPKPKTTALSRPRPTQQEVESETDPQSETKTVRPDPIETVVSELDVVRRLAAERAEFPLESIKPSDRLLSDLHLSSIAVGQLVVEAAKALGLPPPASPTDAAGATVGELAQALQEQLRHGPGDAAQPSDPLPAGVDSWVRGFTVELVPRRLPPSRPMGATGPWRVVAGDDYPLKDAIEQAFGREAAGQGVVVCMPRDPDHRQIELLLEAARAVLDGPPDRRFVLVQHGGGVEAFARTLHLELPEVVTCVVDVPITHPEAVEWVEAESRSAVGYTEAYYDDTGTRREAVLRRLPATGEPSPVTLGPDDVLLVTGGGKGIAAESALTLAKETGARLALLGRSRAADNAELAANLERIRAAGVDFRYLPADVTDRQAVTAAVREAEAGLGPITAVLHGAGSNTPKRLGLLDAESFLRTLRPKVDGLQNVLAAVDPARLRLLVTFGSIIARTGMHGQADYAVANQWLTRLTERWQAEHPACRCLAVEWSVWSGVGMGERLGTMEALKQQGITPIPPEEGVRMLRRLIGRELPSVAVVVTGRFGEPPTLKLDKPELPLLRFLQRPRVHIPGVELVCEADLSADTDPYLKDHVYQGVPLFLAVMGLEAMAQAAMGLRGSTDPPQFEDVRFLQPIVVPEGGQVTIRIAALMRRPDRIDVVLRSEETGFQVDHFMATCRFGRPDDDARRETIGRQEGDADGTRLQIDPMRDLYGGILFHSGRFRRITGYRRLKATECVAEITPSGTADWFGQYLPGKLVLGDAAVRDAVIHAIQACIPHGTLLPVGVDRLVPCVEMTGPMVVHARERSRDGELFVYDLEVTDPDGVVRERWEGLQLRRVSQSMPSETWAEPLLGPYIERRIGELIPGSAASVVLERNGSPDRHARSDNAIQLVLGTRLKVHRRPDGKPEVVSRQAVSVSHVGDLTMAVAGSGIIACDAERLAQRSPQMWRDLLGVQRNHLAELIAQRLDEDLDTAAARVWTAAECLKKAGASLDVPLVFRTATDDQWVLLAAGELTIATWVAPIRETKDRMAMAVLVGDENGNSTRL